MSKYYTEKENEKALENVAKHGFPKLSLFKDMKEFNPKLINLFIEKEVLVNNYETLHISPEERELIYCVVSATNNCEMCLSFHSLGLINNGTATQEEVDILQEGGIPENSKLKPIVIATKYALSHKGILLEREKLHLLELGIDSEKYAEILFFSGMIYANNMLMVYLINEGVNIEDFLKNVGPFRKTVYDNDATNKLEANVV